CVRVNSNFDYW
nr:immunoglobulin heavy chain junction region [Macaca mulatta]MOV50007.1 immunoglobulin heavy chain junction region [Macaca mulatta]MOV50352.1 immunoglobulin heavy chain junction region [Macaca mulatta]MOV50866.1 immunoglobulin heavy chain junction region [Macaca mulatta]MOV51763.1 immunoglobulin heavy chain junction region [Macaca mulatta]